MKLYSVYDRKAAWFKAPFQCRTDAEAMRAFFRAIQDMQTDMSAHPGDYALFRVGERDESTGVITGVSPVEICSGTSEEE